jgi:hypothetical protein
LADTFDFAAASPMFMHAGVFALLRAWLPARCSSSALPTTLTLLKAIAAPAITGLSRPKAASGMPTTL